VPQKEIATLLRAVPRLRARRPVRLLLHGDGPERSALGGRAGVLGIASDVRFLGRVANAPAYMTAAAVVALTSAWEGFGRVLVEALAVGCPVVSTDCPSGPREILEGGAWGPLVPVGDAAALGAALEAVIDHPPDRAMLTKRSRAFTLEHGVQRYLDVLQARSARSEA
jgi:glycosyltransferase involved in cell wall biosynthesis